MPMLEPQYNPINFKQIDMRKYHIRDLADVAKFTEFIISRMEEMRQVVRNSNNELGTLRNVNAQLRSINDKRIASYHNPAMEKTTDEIKVETIEKTVNAEHEALLSELREAEEHQEVHELGDDANHRDTAEIEHQGKKYRATAGKNRTMYYVDGKLTAEKEVPEEVKELLGFVEKGN